MSRYKITIEGARLMMHNEQLANPFNAYTKQPKVVTHKRNKTEEDYLEIARIEYQGGLYYKDDVGPYMPAHCIQKMLIEGAKKRKLGRAFSEGLVVLSDAPVEYEGPRTREELWSAEDESGTKLFADMRLVGVGQARTLRTRPLFRDWKISFSVQAADDVVQEEDVRNALASAELIGLGDGRPMYAGQFSTKEVKKDE